MRCSNCNASPSGSALTGANLSTNRLFYLYLFIYRVFFQIYGREHVETVSITAHTLA